MKLGYYLGKNIKNNVSYFLEEHANNIPDKIAFYFLSGENNSNFEHDSITYKEFNEQVKRVAASFLKLGIKPGDRSIVFVPISTELYIIIGGLQRIGAVPVFLDSWARKEHLASAIQNSKPSSFISLGKAFELFDDFLNACNIDIKISIDKYRKNNVVPWDELFSREKQDIIPTDQDDIALITYTTGSSGIPKGANRTHRFLAAQHYALKRLFPYKEDDIDLPVFPVFALNNIASGITTVIPAIDISKPSPKDPETIYSQMKKCEVNCMTLAPSSFRNIAAYCRNKNIELSKMRRVLTGGAPISEIDVKRFCEIAPNSENWVLYGSTEVEPIAYIESKEILAIKAEVHEKNTTEIGVNVGKIDSKLSYKLIEINQNNIEQDINTKDIEVQKNEIGELIVSGENVCRSYYNNKEAFLRAKIKDKDGIIWHRTGDLGRIDKNGYLWIVGRIHSIVERDGKYFFPVRPEIILKDLQGVINAAYLSVDFLNDSKIVTVITISDVANNDNVKNQLRGKIKKIFAKEKIPLDMIIFKKDIPMDVRHHSKVSYQRLREEIFADHESK